MTDISQAIKLIGGVEPTSEQVQRVQAIAHSLEIANNDPLLPILIALDCYHGIFSNSHRDIERCADAAANAAAAQSNLLVQKIIAKAILDIEPAAAKAINSVATKVAGKQMFQWGAGALSVAFICLTMAIGFAHSLGFNDGKATGYSESKDEKAAAAWANTPQGKSAYLLAQNGDLDAIIHCKNNGWYIKNGNCFPAKDSDNNISGWKVP